MDGFTRQETLALTGSTSSRLAYLDRIGIIVPQKYGNPKKPTVIYSWEQVLEVRTVGALRRKISLQMVRRIVQFLDQNGVESSLHDKHLVVTADEVYWVQPDWSDMPQVMKVVDRHHEGVGQMMLWVLPPLADIVKDIWQAAQTSKIVDFESFKRRAKAVPREAV